MEIKVNIPPNQGVLIPLPSEKVNLPSDVILEIEGKKVKPFDWYTFEKNEPFPKALFFLATGMELTSEAIWKKYPNSDKIYLFVVKL